MMEKLQGHQARGWWRSYNIAFMDSCNNGIATLCVGTVRAMV